MKTNCGKCGTEILAKTAEVSGGMCWPCHDQQPVRRARQYLTDAGEAIHHCAGALVTGSHNAAANVLALALPAVVWDWAQARKLGKAASAFSLRPRPPSSFRELLRDLLDVLDTVGQVYESLQDTVTREALHAVAFQGFVLQKPGYCCPRKFWMMTVRGNQLLRRAMRLFLRRGECLAANEGLDTPEKRMAAFQDASVVSGEGSQYDTYFGHVQDLQEYVAASQEAAGRE